MVVAYNCDENYISTFAVSVVSLFEMNQWADKIMVYLISKDISEKSRQRCKEIADRYQRDIVLLEMPEIDVPKIAVGYGRLFLGELLPKDTDKAIYIDCDTITVDSLEELWKTNVDDYYAGMVIDPLGPNDRKMLGICPDGLFYSDALMLVNIKRWREEHIIGKFIAYIKSMNGVVPLREMGTLTAVLDGKIKILPARYNVQVQYFSFLASVIVKMRNLKEFYNDAELEAAKNDPVMIHFNVDFLMPLRPWEKGCNHPYTQKYIRYRQMTPWKDEPLSEGRVSAVKRILSVYYRFSPKAIARLSVKVYYAYLWPLLVSYERKKMLRDMR